MNTKMCSSDLLSKIPYNVSARLPRDVIFPKDALSPSSLYMLTRLPLAASFTWPELALLQGCRHWEGCWLPSLCHQAPDLQAEGLVCPRLSMSSNCLSCN